ncbi:DegT/DnrJ/EryC1/StrS family aminotransferase [Peribacillus frigoritolerans]|uniref:DegT/DnrJ/EryC1/StrS family aminotransferase n=1 Tax=Peribacillus frigoritolerans TaxID=450367 RepID=A0AAJ1QNN9_9BACI|nr:DegT/DnrJ/EryC1/StrS family aminotransferase [Peribacillus frigoritolerans]MDM5284688.1 DegT/DnrJ/EryC1/StrS family aminotransferase [Peribacillus frigoritolerans]
MHKKLKPFEEPIFVTKPLLPDLNDILNKLKEVWNAQLLTNNGTQHRILEEKLKHFLGVPAISLFNNGTTALMVACKSLGITGDVITTPFTFAATPHILTWNTLNPVFCDIDPLTMNIDPNKIESMITPQTTAILAVHVFGTPCDVYKIQEIANQYKLKIIYDAAHAFNLKINGENIGNFGDITMFSFHATKLFHTAEGGALTYRDKSLTTRINLMKNFGIKNEEEVILPGINGKMNEIQAVLGLVVLEMIEEERRKREQIRTLYWERLNEIEGISLLPEIPGVQSSLQYFPIRINKEIFGISRDDLYEELKTFNIFTRKYFYPLCSDFPCYRNLPSASPHNLPNSQQVVNEVLVLPFYGGLGLEKASSICEIIKSIKESKF